MAPTVSQLWAPITLKTQVKYFFIPRWRNGRTRTWSQSDDAAYDSSLAPSETPQIHKGLNQQCPGVSYVSYQAEGTHHITNHLFHDKASPWETCLHEEWLPCVRAERQQGCGSAGKDLSGVFQGETVGVAQWQSAYPACMRPDIKESS